MNTGKKFNPTFESLTRFECPKWFRDAKFGIWSHWGPQSVPMCGDWYARNMYMQGSPQYLYHLRHYGHPSKFGYKDICAFWKAEKFDPDALMKLYHKSGARYFVGQAMHHDHFFNFPSKLNRFNSMQVGPKKDICGLWKAAAEKNNMPFGFTEHLGATFSWWRVNKGSDAYGPYKNVPYDGNDPEYRDFYLDNYEHPSEPDAPAPWYTSNEKFRDYWLSVMKELIDLYKPDLLYSDGSLPFGEHWHNAEGLSKNDLEYRWGLEAVSHLYNTSIEKNGENHAVYTQKSRSSEIYSVGVLDIEKSQLPGINPNPWQTDTCIGNWFYDAKQEFKKPAHIIEMLVDIISKNGTMLLNILQKPDGSIDDETVYILEELAKWFAICGDAVYGTRPWKIYGEGDTQVLIDGFKEVKTTWNSSDYRFTAKENKLYAFILKPADNHIAVIKSLDETDKVKSVKILGGDNLSFVQAYGVLTVKLPDILPSEYTNCLEIDF
ncbi:MAG: alpha-L-fucosidase [Oscillospiraceae bacterium]|nr:alpha-L-fucosidase [Oscillospiraceae bacterium]